MESEPQTEREPQAQRRSPGAGAAGGRATTPRGFVRWSAGLLGAFNVLFGVWAFGWPQSFYDNIAIFPPYNEHLLHDMGAFNLGVGVALVLALRWRDGLMVALGAFAAAGTVHTIGHVIDADLGGRDIDVPLLGLLALIAIAALVVRARALRGTRREA